MSGIPQQLGPKTSSQNSKQPKNHPQTYWIIYDEKYQYPNQTSNNKPYFDSQSKSQNSSSQQIILFSSNSCQKTNNQQNIIKILSDISTQYATHRFINNLSSEITKQIMEQIIESIQKQFSKFKLTKRNLVFSILIPNISQSIKSYINASPYFTKIIQFYYRGGAQSPIQSKQNIHSPQNSPKKLLKISRKASIIDGSIITVDLAKSEQQIQQQLIKQMKLDFIWLGVLSRLGTDVQRFQQVIMDEQDFSPQYIGFYDKFFEQLNGLIFQKLKDQDKKLFSQSQLPNLLNQAHQKASLLNKQISPSVQQLIRSKFSSRIIISDIVSTGDYLTLLLSRNYFNLLYIQSDTLVRFKQFNRECEAKFQVLANILDIETFLIIDDFWYRTFVLKCIPHAKFIIDRGNQTNSYSDVITKNYKQIIPSYRPNFDEYFLSICNVLKQRSGCLKEAVGSIIVKDKRIVATGYNGTPIDCVNCFNGGCKICNNSQKMNTQVLSCTCIHSQYGCILQAGIKITPGSILYSTKFPCLWCCKLIVQGNISKIVYLRLKYPHLQYENMTLAKQILAKANVDIVQVEQTKHYISI